MYYAENFRSEAREALKGKWGKAVGVGFVASFFGASTIGLAGSSSGSASNFEISDLESVQELFSMDAWVVICAVIGAFSALAVVMSLVRLIVGSTVTLGYCRFHLNLAEGKEASLGDLFSRFGRIGQAIALYLLTAIYTALWSLLFVIPGIIKSYSYAMAPFILEENPGMAANDAITKSRELMHGNKWRLFCLQFSFLGWCFLCLFTCGIGMLWVNPYREASYASFYREIKREKYGEPTVEGEMAVEAETVQ